MVQFQRYWDPNVTHFTHFQWSRTKYSHHFIQLIGIVFRNTQYFWGPLVELTWNDPKGSSYYLSTTHVTPCLLMCCM